MNIEVGDLVRMDMPESEKKEFYEYGIVLSVGRHFNLPSARVFWFEKKRYHIEAVCELSIVAKVNVDDA